jgi:DNA processing protein
MSKALRMEDVLLSLAIHGIRGIGCMERVALKEMAVSTERFAAFSAGTAEMIIGHHMTHRWYGEDLLAAAEKILSETLNIGAEILLFQDPRYPAELRFLGNPPFLLFVRGVLPCPSVPMISVVGTRKPKFGTAPAKALGREASLCSVPVVSGLAAGVDSAAHYGAMTAGGPTVAVLGSGIDWIYPRHNRNLASEILSRGGCILSEYPPGSVPEKKQFPERNRIIAALSKAVIVAEAPGRSGALITATHALELGKEIYIHTSGINNENSLGTQELFLSGATAISSFSEILSEWGLTGRLGSWSLQTPRNTRSEVRAAAAAIQNPGKRVAYRVRKELEAMGNTGTDSSFVENATLPDDIYRVPVMPAVRPWKGDVRHA